MEEGNDKIEKSERIENQEIFSKSVRAGKRTYFFDVKTTRRNDHYLTITESKKRFHKDGRFYFEKHKIFLYKEDFDKFSEGLSESIGFIKDLKVESPASENGTEEKQMEGYTNVEFEDLESVEAADDEKKDSEE
ncbi:MAG: DUF3276 family protein [Bacteroidales bacterium]|nr:DUF3276 family protein [Bacteroidales bacterium]